MKKARILITGASGMLGTALLQKCAADYECFALSRTRGTEKFPAQWLLQDITDTDRTCKTIEAVHPDVIVHCAAMVNVDACEKNIQAAEALHIRATETLAEISWRTAIHLIYISTDQVFNGQKKGLYKEEDLPAPLNTYGRTKLAGEQAVLAIEKGLVLRSNIFGWTSQKKSFGEWILSGLRNREAMKLFTDVWYSPISTYGLVDTIRQCIDKEVKGLFHAGGKVPLSKYAFAMQVAAAYGLPTGNIVPAKLADVPLTAPRPTNMALDSSKLERELGTTMPDVQVSIMEWKHNEPERGNL